MGNQVALFRAIATALSRTSRQRPQTSEAEYRSKSPLCATGYGGQHGNFIRTMFHKGERIGVYLTTVRVSWTGQTHIMEHYYALRRGKWVRVAKARRIA